MKRTGTLAVALFSFVALAFATPVGPTYENLNSVLWFQTSVDYQANATQTYRSAEKALVRALANPRWTAALEQTSKFQTLPPAVILDLDETVLDNSAHEARLVASGDRSNDAAWESWMNEESAGLIPGALHFLQFARARGVTPLYVSNRTCDPTKANDPTVKLLQKLGVPVDPAAAHVFCRQGAESDKTARRAKCAAKFHILLLIGDQLGDFLTIPAASADLAGRQKLYQAHEALWGERWFQLPNPLYGSWLTALGSTIDQKLSHLKK